MMYVDDSGNPTLKGGQYYVLSGIIIHETSLRDIENRVRHYKETNFKGLYANKEIHAYYMYQGEGDFKDIDPRSRIVLLRNLYTSMSLMPITIISVGIEKRLIQNAFPYWNPLRAAWIFITERFDRYISENSMNSLDKGIIMIDKGSRSSDKVATSVINHIRKNGSNTQQINHIIEEPVFISSAVSEPMQIADASAYCTMKYLTNASKFVNYWDMIYNKLRKGPNGNIIGYGLKVFPRKEVMW
ncbi:MAG: DUF3800 domain-containing protein [Nitrososphaeraceae archaeon]|nr:DUF3800 domain-containing protein [Nitrososphaeraceae archaeon]